LIKRVDRPPSVKAPIGIDGQRYWVLVSLKVAVFGQPYKFLLPEHFATTTSWLLCGKHNVVPRTDFITHPKRYARSDVDVHIWMDRAKTSDQF
jgi:hypothetical protein